MNASMQKYAYETFLYLGVEKFCLLRPSDNFEYYKEIIPEHKKYVDESNIYILCKKPRIRFLESSISYDQDKLKIGFELCTKNGIKKVFGVLENYHQFFPNAAEFFCHDIRTSKLVVKLSKGITVTYPIEAVFKLFDSCNNFQTILDSEIRHYEVLYIGKSYGKKNTSNAYKRVQNKHEKIQEILIDILENEPYNELFVLLMDVDRPELIGICIPDLCDDRIINNIDRAKNFDFEDKFSKEEVVDITEACLIKYFDPIYNKNLKNKKSFGKEKIFQKCKNHDVNSISTIVDATPINLCLYSPSVEAKEIHEAFYNLHNENNRITFDYLLSLRDG